MAGTPRTLGLVTSMSAIMYAAISLSCHASFHASLGTPRWYVEQRVASRLNLLGPGVESGDHVERSNNYPLGARTI